jgi:hypothetical protein
VKYPPERKWPVISGIGRGRQKYGERAKSKVPIHDILQKWGKMLPAIRGIGGFVRYPGGSISNSRFGE